MGKFSIDFRASCEGMKHYSPQIDGVKTDATPVVTAKLATVEAMYTVAELGENKDHQIKLGGGIDLVNFDIQVSNRSNNGDRRHFQFGSGGLFAKVAYEYAPWNAGAYLKGGIGDWLKLGEGIDNGLFVHKMSSGSPVFMDRTDAYAEAGVTILGFSAGAKVFIDSEKSYGMSTGASGLIWTIGWNPWRTFGDRKPLYEYERTSTAASPSAAPSNPAPGASAVPAVAPTAPAAAPTGNGAVDYTW